MDEIMAAAACGLKLKDGIVTEKNGGGELQTDTLKEFEVLPATAGVIIAAVSGADSEAKLNAQMLLARIRIKNLPPRAWNISVLEQMSAEDLNVMHEAIREFDENFIFAPPRVRI